MKILKCESEEIENPHANPYNLADTQLRDMRIFDEGTQAVLDEMVDVDLDEMAKKWVISSGSIFFNSTPFEEYLKEQLKEAFPKC